MLAPGRGRGRGRGGGRDPGRGAGGGRGGRGGGGSEGSGGGATGGSPSTPGNPEPTVAFAPIRKRTEIQKARCLLGGNWQGEFEWSMVRDAFPPRRFVVVEPDPKTRVGCLTP